MFGELISDDLNQCDVSPVSGYEAVRAQYTEEGEIIVRRSVRGSKPRDRIENVDFRPFFHSSSAHLHAVLITTEPL